jgi:hypothetical protein
MRFFFLAILMAGLTLQAAAQGPVWSLSAGPSFHFQDFEEPLPWWETGGQLFPSLMVHVEFPMRFVEGPLGRHLHFSTGVRYVRLASRVDWEFEVSSSMDVFTGRFKISQHYLAVPLQLRVGLGKTPFFLLAGPELGILVLAQKKSDTLTPETFSSSQRENVGQDLHRLNISLYGGIGARLTDRISCYARYGAGLRGTKKDAERPVLDSDWRSREIEFGAQFKIGPK